MTQSKFRAPLLWAACAVSAFAQQFQDQTGTRLPTQNIWSEEVDAGDIDGDGDLDLVYAKGDGFATAGTARQNTILLNDGTGVFTDVTAARLPALTGNAKDVDFVDVDDDGDLDLVVANGFNQQPRLFLNDGLGFFTNATATNFPTITLNSFSSTAGDIDADGDIDLVFTDSGASTFGGAGGQTRVFVNNGSGVFADQTATRMPVSLVVAAVDANLADVDSDGDLDLFVMSRDGTPSKLYYNDGAGVFAEGAALPSDGTGTYEYEIGDVDGDLDADVFVVGISGLNEGTLVNGGAGTFTTGVNTVLGNPGSDDNDAALGDIDNDGDFDCVVAALSTAERVFTNNGAGVFTYNASLITGFTDSSMDGEFADVDNDGDLDYLSAVGESGAFQNRVYINTSATAADTQPPLFRLPNYGPNTPFGNLVVRIGIKDVKTTDGDPGYQSVVLNWTVSGVPGSAPMKWAGGDLFQATIPGITVGAPVTLSATCVDREGNSGTSATLSFSPSAFPPVALSVVTTGVGDVSITLSAPGQPFVEEFVVVSGLTGLPVGSGPFIGLGPDAFAFLQFPFGVAPFHFMTDAAGVVAGAYPPGTVPTGVTFDARAILLPLGAPPQLSNIVRRAF
jgi:hypothetical protein